MKKIITLTAAVAIAVFAASSIIANGITHSMAKTNAAAIVSAAQDDHSQMGKMTPKKSAGKGMKKMSAKKKAMGMKKKSPAKKAMNMKKKPMKKKSKMVNMNMNDMDMR